MKKYLSIVLCLCMLLTSFAFTAVSADGTPTLTIVAPTTVEKNQEFEVKVNLSNAGTVKALTVNLVYDPDKFEVVSGVKHASLANINTAKVDSGVTSAFVNFADASGVALDGTMLTVKFKGKIKTDYTFAFGKVMFKDSANSTTIDYTSTASISVTNPKYRVQFMVDEGLVYAADIEEGTFVTNGPSNPSKDPTAQYTYTFANWYVKDSMGIESDVGDVSAYAINGPTTFYAKFNKTVNKYTVKINGTDYTDVEYGKKISEIISDFPAHDDEDEDGLPFMYWGDASDNEVTLDTVVTGNMVIEPKFGGEVYTVKFYNGETLISTVKVPTAKPKAISAPAATTKAQDVQYIYTFDKWATNTGVAFDSTALVNADADYYAQYTTSPSKYTVKIKYTVDETTYEFDASDVEYGTSIATVAKNWTNETAGIKNGKISGMSATYTVGDAKITKVASNLTAFTTDTQIYDVTFKKTSSGGVASGTVISSGSVAKKDDTKTDENKEEVKTDDEKTDDENKDDEKTDDTNTDVTTPSEIASADDFKDLDGFDWAKTSIDNLIKLGVLSGSGDGNYNPSNSVTRAEIAKMISLVFGLDAVEADATDVPKDAWYNGFVGALKAKGIMSGYEDGSFKPENAITREEMAKLIVSAIGEDVLAQLVGDVSESKFTDADEISDWALSAVNQLAALGVITGYEDGSFRPSQVITRAEAAVIIDRVSALLNIAK